MSNGYVQRDAEGVPREFNICGVLVQARPERQLDVEAALAELPGVE